MVKGYKQTVHRKGNTDGPSTYEKYGLSYNKGNATKTNVYLFT